jgi:hypothetical protein
MQQSADSGRIGSRSNHRRLLLGPKFCQRCGAAELGSIHSSVAPFLHLCFHHCRPGRVLFRNQPLDDGLVTRSQVGLG